MEREPFKNTVFGIILLGVISGVIANQFGFINISQVFRSSSAADSHKVQIIDGRPTPRLTPAPPKATPTPQLPQTAAESTSSPVAAPQLRREVVAQAQEIQVSTQTQQVPPSLPQQVPPQKVIVSPEIKDMPMQSSSSIFWQDLRASVVKMRSYDGLTAVTFKIDGSTNSDPYRWIPAPTRTSQRDFYTNNTNIIDQNGRRYHLLSDNANVPEQTQYNGGNYVLAPHETVFVTYLFEALDPAARRLNITFPEIIKDGNLDVGRVTIHVALQ